VSKFLLIPNSNNKKILFDYSFDGIILPLENFSIGFDFYFTISMINELSIKHNVYVIVNKFFHYKDILEFKRVFKKIKNVKGYFIEDVGLVDIIGRKNIILFQNHIINNYESINYLNEIGIKDVVVSNELTKGEIYDIRKNTKSNLYYFLINRNMLMYSKRKLISNYFENFNIKSNEGKIVVKERVSRHELLVKEEGSSSCIFDGKIFVGELCELDYYIININNMSEEEVCEVLNNYKGEVNIFNKDNYFLKNKISYKVISDEKS